ncbi:uncharacterized protein PV09_00266 [Verruconis gallopava]|uniref:SAC3/GANP/THP3 conserved domain-containing protein n=1 Tax=Verruconis gallopava TaxID=253628 RepID=A0A0D2ARP3_9PEZI|nr:uncharacterized protein PV09_00266 [Verruconis gallopava]KIW09368.1 hypothetical protein PV09_00266 [Verruconis gallopava]
MSAPARGARGARGTRARGGSRAGTNSSRSKASDGNDSDAGSTARKIVPRGRGRGATVQSTSRGIAQALQQVAKQQNASRGSKTTGRGSKAGASHLERNAADLGSKSNSNETPDQRFQRLKAQREVERTQAQNKGLISGDKAVDLKNAVTIVGTCQEMCSEFERARRILQKDVAGPERITIEKDNGEIERVVDESKMVKKFQRSAAGIDEQLPSDLRPPEVLLKTTNYLFNDILSDEDSLQKANMFIWDRTRAIRNDFSIQQVKRLADVRIAIECYEKIARYHILSLHQIGGRGPEYAGPDYNWQQDREQLDKTLLSLLTYYDHVKLRYRSPNEVEFRSYWIVFQIGNVTDSVEEKVQSWSHDVLKHPRIQRALDIYAASSDVISPKGPLRPFAYLAVAQQNWQKFWNLVGSKQTSYLMSCVAEIGFNVVRRAVLTTISMTYNPGGKKEVQDWTLEKMTEVLGFDDEYVTRDFIEQSNLMIGETNDGTDYLKLTIRQLDGLPEPSAELPKQLHSWHLVERKRFGRSWPAVIAGLSFKEAKENGMLVPDWNEEAMAHYGQDHELFVDGSDAEQTITPKESAQINPFASVFAPTRAAEERKPGASNSFGQPSAFNQPLTSVEQTTTTPSSFGLPSSTQQSSAPTAQTSISTFGPLPKAFNFTSSQASSQAFVNPFPTSKASQVTTEAPTTNPPNPFNNFASKTTTESSKDLSNPFANASTSTTTTSKQEASNPFSAFVAPKTTSVPLVQITPPETKDDKASAGASKKVTFDLPSSPPGRLAFGTTSAPASLATPFSFASNSTTGPSQKERGGILKLSAAAITPTKVGGNDLDANSAQSVQPTATTSTPPATSASKVQAPPLNPSTQSLLSTFEASKPSSSSDSGPINVPSAPQTVKTSYLPDPPKASALCSTPALLSNIATEARLWEETRKTKAMDYLAEQLVCDPDPFRGYFKQYVAKIAEPLIKEIIEQEEARTNLKLATKFRRKRLQIRYGYLWKRNAAMLKSRRKRLEMKQRNAEARLKRSSFPCAPGNGVTSVKVSLDEEFAAFKAREQNKRIQKEEATENEQERLRHSSREENSQYTVQKSGTNSFDHIGQRHVEPNPLPLSSTQLTVEVGALRGHQRSQTQPHAEVHYSNLSGLSNSPKEASPPLSISSDRSSRMRASLINGGSMVDTGFGLGMKASSMQSPYFRLKAAGFGPTWKSSTAPSVTGMKRPRLSGDDILANGSTFDGLSSSVTANKRLRSPANLSSLGSPVAPAPDSSLAASFGSSNSSVGAYRRSAKDEELLARARKIREALEEGENWFKEEVQRDELRRSQELHRSQADTLPPPSTASLTGPNGEDLSKLPKFYSRVSRFVPREEYGIRKEKRGSKDESKGKEKSDLNGLGNGLAGRGRQAASSAPAKSSPSKGGTSWDDAIEL